MTFWENSNNYWNAWNNEYNSMADFLKMQEMIGLSK